jgi:hypothetical protein
MITFEAALLPAVEWSGEGKEYDALRRSKAWRILQLERIILTVIRLAGIAMGMLT